MDAGAKICSMRGKSGKMWEATARQRTGEKDGEMGKERRSEALSLPFKLVQHLLKKLQSA